MQGIRGTPVCGWTGDMICLSLPELTSSCSGHWAKSDGALLAHCEGSQQVTTADNIPLNLYSLYSLFLSFQFLSLHLRQPQSLFSSSHFSTHLSSKAVMDANQKVDILMAALLKSFLQRPTC